MKRLMVITACLIGVVVWLPPAAFPWYSQVTANMTCDGTVSWTASAWAGPTPASRENPDVRVWVSYDGGTTYTQVGSGAFDQAHNFSFSGSFSAGSATSALIKVHEEADWPGDGGDVPGAPHYATATRPTGCATTPPSTPTPPTPPQESRTGYCDASGVFINLLVGQDKQAPYDSLGLRPADVNPATGAQYCSQPTAPPARTGYCDSAGTFYNLVVGQDKQPPYDTLGLTPAAVNPATGALYCAREVPVAAVAGARHTLVPKVKKAKKAKHAVKAPKPKPKKKATPKAAKHPVTLPFTK